MDTDSLLLLLLLGGSIKLDERVMVDTSESHIILFPRLSHFSHLPVLRSHFKQHIRSSPSGLRPARVFTRDDDDDDHHPTNDGEWKQTVKPPTSPGLHQPHPNPFPSSVVTLESIPAARRLQPIPLPSRPQQSRPPDSPRRDGGTRSRRSAHGWIGGGIAGHRKNHGMLGAIGGALLGSYAQDHWKHGGKKR